MIPRNEIINNYYIGWICVCLFAYVTYNFEVYVMCTLLGMWDSYTYYYSYTPLMSCLHLVSYKLPASYPAAVKRRFHVM